MMGSGMYFEVWELRVSAVSVRLGSDQLMLSHEFLLLGPVVSPKVSLISNQFWKKL